MIAILNREKLRRLHYNTNTNIYRGVRWKLSTKSLARDDGHGRSEAYVYWFKLTIIHNGRAKNVWRKVWTSKDDVEFAATLAINTSIRLKEYGLN